MSFEQKIKQLEQMAAQIDDNNKLQDKTYFLDDDHVLTFPRFDGESRYPYGTDGFNFWACSSGYLYTNESTYDAFEVVQEGVEPNIAFFAGLLKEDGTYEALSLLGVPVNIDIDAKRYVIHTPKAAYYFTYYKGLEFCVRVFVDEDKVTYFSIQGNNTTNESVKMYLSTYMEPTLLYGANWDPNVRWWREGGVEETSVNSLPSFVAKMTQDTSRTTKVMNFGVINRTTDIALEKTEITASRRKYMGGKNNSLSSSTPLKTGTFGDTMHYCTFIDMAAFGDLNFLTLEPNSPIRFEVSYASAHEDDEVKALLARKIVSSEIDAKVDALMAMEKEVHNRFNLTMGNFKSEKIHKEAFNHFFGFVQRQVEYCALGKSYAGPYLGFRDVSQQIEGALLWQTEKCADKIVDALSFIDPSGRCPRMFSYPAEGVMPKMDLNLYIDQGCWILSTVITYLRYTKDFALLDRMCGYYEIVDAKNRIVKKADYEETVLQHVIKVLDFLIATRDMDLTKCVRAMFGDWNDALDGLGVSKEPGVEFGTGVSVMVTLQVFQNTQELIELLTILGKDKYAAKIAEYQKANDEIRDGLLKYAVVTNDKDEKKILHGWGDKRSYVVGGFEDVDGEDRVGLTSYAFWVLSGMYDLDPSMKETILHAFSRLDAKYGLRTFDKSFAPDAKGVGRIVTLPAGTAENAASYIHATMFGIASLFRMGCSKEALEQLEKALPMTHDIISATPFIMANSYCYNPEKNIDGQSMNDWHTGSAAVLLKMMVKFVVGFDPCFGGYSIHPSAQMPMDSFEFTLYPRGSELTISYKNENKGSRTFTVNGEKRATRFDEVMKTEVLWIPDDEIVAGKKIVVCVTD